MRRSLRQMQRLIISGKRVGLLIFFSTLAACLSLDPPTTEIDPLPPGGHHVLFIGNSLTYTYDLPGTVSQLARSVGDTVRVRSVALPNFAVIDHALGLSNAVDVIRSQPWEYVLLQQGPTTLDVNRDTLIIATKLLDPSITGAGAKSAQLMTWPNSNQLHLFASVRASSQLAADAVGGVFIPVGEAWRKVIGLDPAIPLYGPDGYHPGPIGTYLGALVVYEMVTGHDARKLPGVAEVGGARLTISEQTVRMLQEAAHATVVEYTFTQ